MLGVASIPMFILYSFCQVTIQSRNEKGVSTAPPTVAYGFSGEAVPTVVPPVPTVLSSTPRGANLQWQAITAAEEPQVQGYFRGYRVEWCFANLTGTECEINKRFQVNQLIVCSTCATKFDSSKLKQKCIENVSHKSNYSCSVVSQARATAKLRF